MDTRDLLRCTTLLFAVVVHHARGDELYHTAFLVLMCSSIIRHWCEFSTPAILIIDRVVAHLCYAVCAYTHISEHPNFSGSGCLAAVLGLWIYEHYAEVCSLNIISA